MGQARLSGAKRRALTGALLALALCGAAPALAGHDQVEDDLTYFLAISAERTKQLLDIGESVWFGDLRSAEEFKAARLPGAHSIPLKDLTRRFAQVPTTGRVVLYCACPDGNIEEGHAYQLLRGFGYRNVSVMEGGFAAWQQLGYPLERGARP